MACLSPLTAWQLTDGSVVFNHHAKNQARQLELPCGQCQGCRLERSRQWATRCMHEAQMHEHNAFITLTYDDEHLPEHSSLVHRDFQLFLKKLRQAAIRGKSGLTPPTWVIKTDGKGKERRLLDLKYYMAGEYGSGDNTERPHYHACLFGIDFTDKTLFSVRNEQELYTSETLAKMWQQGHCSTAQVTFESAAYVARYVMKKVTGDKAEQHYTRLDPTTGEIYLKTPEYNQMSKGLGLSWLRQYQADVYPHGKTVMNGHEINAPRYYDKKYQEIELQTFQDETQWSRQQNAQLFAAHQTDERRTVRAKVLRAKMKLLRRDL